MHLQYHQSEMLGHGHDCQSEILIQPGLRGAITPCSRKGTRGIANMVELLGSNYCSRNDISMLAQRQLFDDEPNAQSRKK